MHRTVPHRHRLPHAIAPRRAHPPPSCCGCHSPEPTYIIAVMSSCRSRQLTALCPTLQEACKRVASFICHGARKEQNLGNAFIMYPGKKSHGKLASQPADRGETLSSTMVRWYEVQRFNRSAATANKYPRLGASNTGVQKSGVHDARISNRCLASGQWAASMPPFCEGNVNRVPRRCNPKQGKESIRKGKGSRSMA